MSETRHLTEAEATRIATIAVDEIGGPRSVYRNPRMAFSTHARREVTIEGWTVEVRYGEISSPAVATVDGWIFQINDEDLELLIRPRTART